MTASEVPRIIPKAAFADPTRLSPVGRTKSERRHLSILDRRLGHLIDRQPRGTSLDSWDAAEVSALRWALRRIADLERLENLAELGGVAPEELR